MTKLLDCNRLAFCHFLDLQRAFDTVQLDDISHLLQDKQVPIDLIKTIKENIYGKNKIQSTINGKIRDTQWASDKEIP